MFGNWFRVGCLQAVQATPRRFHYAALTNSDCRRSPWAAIPLTMRDHMQYLVARAIPLGVGIVVMPICAQLYPADAWAGFAVAMASVSLGSSVGAALRPLTVRNLHDPTAVNRILSGKLGLAIITGGICAVLVPLSGERGIWYAVVTGLLSMVLFLGGDADLLMAARLPPREFRTRLLAVSVLGNGLQVCLGFLAPTTMSLVASSMAKSLAGFSYVLRVCRVRLLAQDSTALLRQAWDGRAAIGASGFTSLSRAAIYWLQLTLLIHVGLDTLVAMAYLVGRYLDPVANTLIAALTDATVRALGLESKALSPRAILAGTWRARVAASSLVIFTSGVMVLLPKVFVGETGAGVASVVFAMGVIAAVRVFVSPNAWIPHAICLTKVLWIGEAIRVVLFSVWAVAVYHYRTVSVAIWGLAMAEVLSYMVFQFMIRRIAPAREVLL